MKARLIETREIAPEVRHFVFSIPDVDEFAFAPGQFLSFVAAVDGREVTRAYSVAAPPRGNRFELCLNRVREGRFSPFLFERQPGDELEFNGPYGTFTLRQPLGDSVFIATGTGIAPMRSFLHHLLPRERERQVTLVFGVRHETGLLYRDEFDRLAGESPNLRFWPTLSRPPETWTGRRGHVQQHLDEALDGRLDVDVYICGLKAMVDDVRAILKAKGFERRRIVYEKFD